MRTQRDDRTDHGRPLSARRVLDAVRLLGIPALPAPALLVASTQVFSVLFIDEMGLRGDELA